MAWRLTRDRLDGDAEITQSRGRTNRECVALGVANVASGLAGGMGGCAMIGQTMINLNSGGRGRLSGVVAGVPDHETDADGGKRYRVRGTLFFASVNTFLQRFDAAGDPARVTLDCRHLSFVDYSAIEALRTLRERYAKAGKQLHVVQLSPRCRQLLRRAGLHPEHGD